MQERQQYVFSQPLSSEDSFHCLGCCDRKLNSVGVFGRHLVFTELIFSDVFYSSIAQATNASCSQFHTLFFFSPADDDRVLLTTQSEETCKSFTVLSLPAGGPDISKGLFTLEKFKRL